MNARDNSLPLPSEQTKALAAFSDRAWDEEIVPAITRYITIPAKSPMFDADWEKHGLLERVITEAAAWIESKKVAGLKLEVVRLPGRTPLIFFEVPATRGVDNAGGNAPGAQTICLYGHLDKQPEFNGWRSDLGPWTPKYQDGKLYGRGGADDGYAVYAAITAIMALDKQGIPRPRCVGLIESCEESGSPDLPVYLDALKARMGDVSLVVCLDSGAGNYDQLWLTTSLRGMVSGVLKVEILNEGIHSGDASGLVPSSFRILRHLLDRLEDSKTGRLLPESFHCTVPPARLEQARATAAIVGDEVWKRFPWACGNDGGPTLPTTTDRVEALLNRTWRPTLSVTGAEGFPDLGSAGNVLRPYTAFKLSLRLPPLVDGADGRAAIEDPAGRQRALQRARHLRIGRPRCALRHHGLERAGPLALARDRAECSLAGTLRRAARLHGAGRYDPAHEHAAEGVPEIADDGLRRARPAQQRAWAERVPARALRQAPDRRGRAGHGSLPVKRLRRAFSTSAASASARAPRCPGTGADTRCS